MSRRTADLPGTGRVTLALLVAIPAVLAYPWQSTRDKWVLGVAAAAVIVLFARWRGLPVTTVARRRLAMTRRNRGDRSVRQSGADTRATALLSIAPPGTEPDVLPLQLIAGYLDRYGIRADAVRITCRDSVSDAGAPERETWIGLTLSAAENLAALRARSPEIPLQLTAEIAVRRLADHLRENGWTAGSAGPDDVPSLFAPTARETWRAIQEDSADYVAAYRVRADPSLPDILAAIWSHPSRETWTAVEIAGTGAHRTAAASCAFRTDGPPLGTPPVSGLRPQHGLHRLALTALDPLSTQRLDGHVTLPDDLLARLRWPSAATVTAPSPSRASRPRHAAAGR